jgi:DnaJ-like protein/PilZ domain-containing protein
LATSEKTQRRKTTRKTGDSRVIRIELKDKMGNPRWITADLVDATEHGIGIALMTPLVLGSYVSVRGNLEGKPADVPVRAEVTWCTETAHGKFRAGLDFVNSHQGFTNGPQQTVPADPGEQDWYEILQLSPNADAETIGRVYRILAQRYHPDNAKSGNREVFLQLTEAHRVLSDPEKRARYDAHHLQVKRRHWNIFDPAWTATGPEAEKRKRQGILSLLYAKTAQDPDRGGMTIRQFEELLSCPREHLLAALWYLKGKGQIQLADNGRYAITVEGFEEAEQHLPSPRRGERQLSLPEKQGSSAE